MNFISKEKYNFTFSKDNEPILIANHDDKIIFETYDCMTNQIKSESDTVSSIDFNKVNPATGPVYVNDCKKGDTLKVNILSIEIEDQAVCMAGKGSGVLSDRLEDMSCTLVKIHNNKGIFKGIELPLNKMIGVIGVAPENEEVNCGTPGSHGGNMDCKIITEGSSIYFPVFVDGALLSLGDVHAIMGDGEIGVTGAEIGAKVTVSVEVIKDLKLSNPLIETYDNFYTIGSALTLDEAYEIAVNDMFDLVLPKTQLSKNDLAMIMSLTCDIEVCQVVDPLKTVRFKMKKDILNKITK